MTGPQFCGREKLLEKVTDAAAAGSPVTVRGIPGSGTSSLAAEAASRLGGRGRVARLDLDPAPGPLHAWRAVARSLRAAGVVPPQGLPDGEGAGPRPEDGASREREGNAPVFLVVDGAGRLVEGEGSGVRRALSGATADGRFVPLYFDRRPSDVRSLMEDARNGGTVSLGLALRLGPVPLAAWLPFVLERFLDTSRWIANGQVQTAVGLTGGHPRATQHLFHVLWESCADAGRVAPGDVEAAFERVLAREGHAFRSRLSSLTPNQRRVLAGLGAGGADPQVYSRSFLRRWELASPSSVQRALQGLREAGLVEQRPEGPPVPSHPLLAAWLRRRIPAEPTA